jgi:hypothetical protein
MIMMTERSLAGRTQQRLAHGTAVEASRAVEPMLLRLPMSRFVTASARADPGGVHSGLADLERAAVRVAPRRPAGGVASAARAAPARSLRPGAPAPGQARSAARASGPRRAGTPGPVLVAPQSRCQQLQVDSEGGSFAGSLRFMRGTLRVGSLSALGDHWQRRGLQRGRRGDIRALAGLSGPVKLSGGGHHSALTLAAPPGRPGPGRGLVSRGTCHCGTSGPSLSGLGPCCLLAPYLRLVLQ